MMNFHSDRGKLGIALQKFIGKFKVIPLVHGEKTADVHQPQKVVRPQIAAVFQTGIQRQHGKIGPAAPERFRIPLEIGLHVAIPRVPLFRPVPPVQISGVEDGFVLRCDHPCNALVGGGEGFHRDGRQRLKNVMLAAAACFFLTALLECFIRLGCTPRGAKGGVLPTVRDDLAESARFLRREQPDVLKLLLLSGAASMFLSGVMVVGYPYLVRTTLGLSSAHYGVAESAAGVAAILGSVAAGFMSVRGAAWMRRLLGVSGVAVLVAGAGFALGLGGEFVVLVAAFSLANMACSAFSVCAMTAIQRRTPESMTGKVMAFVYTLSLCAQPLGQLLYGVLFDALPPAWVLIPSGAVVAASAIASRGFFSRLDLP